LTHRCIVFAPVAAERLSGQTARENCATIKKGIASRNGWSADSAVRWFLLNSARIAALENAAIYTVALLRD